MKKLWLALLSALSVVSPAVAGTYYIVPPYIDDLTQSVKSSLTYTLNQGNVVPTSDSAFTITLNGKTVLVHYACKTIDKINCQMGTDTIHASVVSYLAVEKDPTTGNYVAATPSSIDLKAKDLGTSWEICAMIGTARGNALLTDHNDNEGTTEDSNNPSWIAIKVVQVCK